MAKTTLAVGTQKGLFLFESTNGGPFTLAGHHLQGWEVSALLLRDRGGPLDLMAGTSHYAYGPVIRRSRDGGATWQQPEGRPVYPKESKFKTKRIWQLSAAPADGALYAGIDEAGLFRSDDDGESWQEVSALTGHPSRPGWQPGAGGLCLHTIVHDSADSRRMWVGISAVGVFRTGDAGASWTPANDGLASVATGSDEPAAVYCIHKIVKHPAKRDSLYMQFHGGVYASDDGAGTWQRRERGLPSNFGFPMVALSDGTLIVAPLVSDEKRYFPDGRTAVYRSENEGRSWQAAGLGNEDGPAFSSVLRDAMCADGHGVYFGTTSGAVAASSDAGRTWRTLDVTLPRVLCVRAITTGAA